MMRRHGYVYSVGPKKAEIQPLCLASVTVIVGKKSMDRVRNLTWAKRRLRRKGVFGVEVSQAEIPGPDQPRFPFKIGIVAT